MQLAQMDSVAWLKSLPDNSIDLMLTLIALIYTRCVDFR